MDVPCLGESRTWLRWGVSLTRARRLCPDLASFRTFASLSAPSRRVGAAARPIHIAALGGQSVFLRPGTTDSEVALATFVGQFHLPPVDIGRPHLIWDLGSNIGTTAAHMAYVFPGCKIFGVELDPANAKLADRNIEPWRDRCRLTRAAVWTHEGEVSYDRRAGLEDGARVGASGRHAAPALTLNSLLQATGPADYVKMDIEGAELEVLRHRTEWAEAVRSISVECHPPYAMEDCARDLRRLGFVTTLFPQTRRRRARSTVVGVRPAQLSSAP